MAKIKYNRLAIIMVEAGVSNEQLAKHMKVSVTSISKWRQNEIQPPVHKFYKVAEYFKVDPRSLFVSREWEEGPSLAEIEKIEYERQKEKGRKKSKSKKKTRKK